jgi:hypothetical protein
MRHRWNLNPCRQSPMDFESISLTTRTQCLDIALLALPQQFCTVRILGVCMMFMATTNFQTSADFERQPSVHKCLPSNPKIMSHFVCDCVFMHLQSNSKVSAASEDRTRVSAFFSIMGHSHWFFFPGNAENKPWFNKRVTFSYSCRIYTKSMPRFPRS